MNWHLYLDALFVVALACIAVSLLILVWEIRTCRRIDQAQSAAPNRSDAVVLHPGAAGGLRDATGETARRIHLVRRSR